MQPQGNWLQFPCGSHTRKDAEMRKGAIKNKWQPRASPKSSVFSLRVVEGVAIAVIPTPTATRIGVNLALVNETV